MRAPLVLAAAILAATAALAHAQLADKMRGATPVADESRPPPLGNVENKDVRRERAYSMQPPTIPHKIDSYQVDLNVNACLGCHSRGRAPVTQAVAVSVSHYMDRDGNFLAEISPRRYFCQQCHVPQEDLKPLVGNRFVDVDEILRSGGATTAGAAKK
ncbi:MAG: nitrate reductase cytochrome c-type subunit [Burkholderiales bacterium]